MPAPNASANEVILLRMVIPFRVGTAGSCLHHPREQGMTGACQSIYEGSYLVAGVIHRGDVRVTRARKSRYSCGASRLETSRSVRAVSCRCPLEVARPRSTLLVAAT